MTSLEEMSAVLARMVELLHLAHMDKWVMSLEGCRQLLQQDATEARRHIRGSYGGTGSLNDVVLQKDGAALHAENDEFDRLRSRLYELAR